MRVEGPLTFNTGHLRLQAVLAGFGLAFLMRDQVEDLIRDGRLVEVLADWCPPSPGYHLYYTSWRQPMPAFALLVVRRDHTSHILQQLNLR